MRGIDPLGVVAPNKGHHPVVEHPGSGMAVRRPREPLVEETVDPHSAYPDLFGQFANRHVILRDPPSDRARYPPPPGARHRRAGPLLRPEQARALSCSRAAEGRGPTMNASSGPRNSIPPRPSSAPERSVITMSGVFISSAYA